MNFVQILPEMMQRFNQNMYDHKRPRPVEPAQEAARQEQGAGPNAEGDNGDAKMAEILNDVEELFWRAGVSHSLLLHPSPLFSFLKDTFPSKFNVLCF